MTFDTHLKNQIVLVKNVDRYSTTSRLGKLVINILISRANIRGVSDGSGIVPETWDWGFGSSVEKWD